ncbi:hypothetical protein I551_3741 [Mycobacterium ulcerans str. Harvey]|uniref:Uncharacterized protein n=1 Tax=Mycobacterium ulcerans str. Harvey TaxID=1299332 RepID=A0ABP3AJ29_MYCUL|nr:hypothetical protein I551_3741 [Mycobacterium ulcerans str. Harvey]
MSAESDTLTCDTPHWAGPPRSSRHGQTRRPCRGRHRSTRLRAREV